MLMAGDFLLAWGCLAAAVMLRRNISILYTTTLLPPEKFPLNPLNVTIFSMVARLAFAIATTIDAEVVLLDEILAVGDASFRERCAERIGRFRDSGATMVLVSHDLEAVQELCARAVWIAEGQVRAVGRAVEVIEAYNRSLHPTAPPLAQAGAGE